MSHRFIKNIKKTICMVSLGAMMLSSFSYVSASSVNITVNGKQVQNGTKKEETAKPDASKTDTNKADVTKTDTNKADTNKADTTKTDNSTTDNKADGATNDGIIPFVNDINGDGKIIVVIDPGHGGKNTGTGWNGIPEKEFSLKVAHAMYDELMLYDNVEAYLTHDDLDKDYGLDERAAIAKAKNADILMSLHFNGTDAHDMYGTDVWVPITPSVNLPAYQMADLVEENLAELGILVRGIKNFWRNNQEYYGIIRHCTSHNIPSLIIEHCHFDNENDNQFMDTDEKLVKMGQADATAVAQYFGLSSKAKDITYSGGRARAVDPNVIHGEADETKPVECKIECNSLDAATGEATINITAYDNESSMLYYAISRDGGNTFGPLQVWPGNDPIGMTSKRTVTVSVGKVTSNTVLTVRAYNYFEQKVTSKNINFAKYFSDAAACRELNNNANPTDPDETPKVGVSRARYHITADKLTKEVEVPEPAEEDDKPAPEKKGVSIGSVLITILIIIIILILILGVLFFIEVQKRKAMRRKRRKAREEEMRRIGRG